MGSRKTAVVVLVFLFSAGALTFADDITTQGWIDGPFFDLLGRFGSLYSAYTATAYSIGRILLMIDLGLMAIMWALNGGEVQKELNKRLLTPSRLTPQPNRKEGRDGSSARVSHNRDAAGV